MDLVEGIAQAELLDRGGHPGRDHAAHPAALDHQRDPPPVGPRARARALLAPAQHVCTTGCCRRSSVTTEAGRNGSGEKRRRPTGRLIVDSRRRGSRGQAPAGASRHFATPVTNVTGGGTTPVMQFRRERSRRRRVLDAARAAPARGLDVARAAPERGRQLREAASQLDIPWARSRLAGVVRENFMRFVLAPLMDYYAARRATGKEKLEGLKGPVILVANHASHLDTPVILSALPRRLRKRTVVAAAADYFYRNRLVASAVSLIFNTVPIERRRGGGMSKNGGHLDQSARPGLEPAALSRRAPARATACPARLRRGAAVLAAAHNLTIVPIRVTGTRRGDAAGPLLAEAPARQPCLQRHRIEVSFGEPITADRRRRRGDGVVQHVLPERLGRAHTARRTASGPRSAATTDSRSLVVVDPVDRARDGLLPLAVAACRAARRPCSAATPRPCASFA